MAGKAGKAWQELARTGKNWQELARTGKDWQGLARDSKSDKADPQNEEQQSVARMQS